MSLREVAASERKWMENHGDLVQRHVARMASLKVVLPKIQRAAARIRRRYLGHLTINYTGATRAIPRFDLQLRGIRVGTIAGDTLEFFPGKAKDLSAIDIPGAGAKWNDPCVRAYLESAYLKLKSQPELELQGRLWQAMFARPKTVLRGYRPCGLPRIGIQFPVPHKYHGSGDHFGHVDILARSGTRYASLCVFELKRPDARDIEGALRQAVTYAAQLEWLTNSECPIPGAVNTHLTLFGLENQRRPVPVRAIALVAENAENRRILSELLGVKREVMAGSIRASAMLYNQEPPLRISRV